MSQSRSSARHEGSGPSQRQLRAAELVRHALTALLARGDLPEDVLAKAFITIPEVEMTPDLKLATVYLVLHDKTLEKAVLDVLKRHHKSIRHQIAKTVNLKYAPDLRYRLDYRLDGAARIDALLARPDVKRDLARASDGQEDHDQ
jgi:ribosome-binding factor A